MKTSRGLFALFPLLFALACGKPVPSDLKPAVDATLPAAIGLAERSALSCAPFKAKAPFQKDPSAVPAPAPAPIPVVGPLDGESHVAEVTIWCMWPDPRSPGVSAGSGAGKLRGLTAKPHAAQTIWSDGKEPATARLSTPSEFEGADADLVVVRPTPDGTVEVRVALRK